MSGEEELYENLTDLAQRAILACIKVDLTAKFGSVQLIYQSDLVRGKFSLIETQP